MPLPSFLKVLETVSSEVGEKTLFKRRFDQYVPDLFFILLHSTLFLFATLLDILYIFYLFFISQNSVQGIIYVTTLILPGLFEVFLFSDIKSFIPHLKWGRYFQVVLSTIGLSVTLNAALASANLLDNLRQPISQSLDFFTFPFFHLTDNTFSIIKIYCLINSALKNMPRLYILPVILLEDNLDVMGAFLGITLIFINMVMFSMTVAVTFPIRSTPRIFTSSICVLFNAFNKFMAAMTSCSIILVTFIYLYKKIDYYAFLLPLFKSLLWGWSSFKALKRRVTLNTCTFLVYFTSLSVFSSFIYIHPFEGIGKLHYYIFSLLDFLGEIMAFYLYSYDPLDYVTKYLIFKFVMIGFLSNFGLINILCKHKYDNTFR